MDAEDRRACIDKLLSPHQKKAVLAHMLSTKKSAAAKASDSEKKPQKERGGIHKSVFNGKVSGYYVKATFQNLTFVTYIHPKPEEAERDEWILKQVINQIQCATSTQDFSSKVIMALEAVLGQEGLETSDFIRFFYVSCSAHHWLGKGLAVFRHKLEDALEAWQMFDDAKEVELFVGGKPGPEYTPERARDQWAQVREVYIHLQSPEEVEREEARLQSLEVLRRQSIAKTASDWWNKEHIRQVQASNHQVAQLARFKKVVKAWKGCTEAPEHKAYCQFHHKA